MNKTKFKQEIDNFLNEIKKRFNDVEKAVTDPKNNSLISYVPIGKSLFTYTEKCLQNDFDIIYSTNGIRLDYIFHRAKISEQIKKDKKQKRYELYNASNWFFVERLVEGIKYQILSHKNKYEGLTKDDFYYVYWGYFCKFGKHFNWNETLNIDKKIYYLEWLLDVNTNIFRKEFIDSLYERIFIEGNKTVTDVHGDIKEINIKNSDYNTMKKLSKEQIIEIIESFDHKPTVKEITDKYMSTVNKDDDDELIARYVSIQLMRKYIQSYEIEDLIKVNKYKKEEKKH